MNLRELRTRIRVAVSVLKGNPVVYKTYIDLGETLISIKGEDDKPVCFCGLNFEPGSKKVRI